MAQSKTNPLKLIVGQVSDRTARIWVQGSASHTTATVRLLDQNGKKRTSAIKLTKADSYTGILNFRQLTPNIAHTVTLTLSGDGESSEGTRGGFRTAPLRDDVNAKPFKFALCSCNARKSDKEIEPFFHLARRANELRTRFTLHLGDNIYYDKKPNKRKSPTLKRYIDKYNSTWGEDPNARQVLKETPNFMTMDDHDIINNFGNGKGKWGFPESRFAKHGIRAFDLFQASHNPDPVHQGTYYYRFSWGNVQFFALDVRTERDRTAKLMISRRQEDVLLSWLRQHRNEMKFVLTGVPYLVGASFDKEDKWNSDDFREQRDRILKAIYDDRISKLAFLTGDMHASYHATMRVKRTGQEAITYHEIMASPLRHWLRGRAGFNVDGPWKSLSKDLDIEVDLEAFTSRRSAIIMTVDPQKEEITCEAFKTHSDDFEVIFEEGPFHI